MTQSNPLPIPFPLPMRAVRDSSAIVIHHRGTETQSHRTEKPQITQIRADLFAQPVASAKTRRREDATKASHSDPSQVLLSGRRMNGKAFKRQAPLQEMISVFLCAPLCLCGEKTTNAPQIGALQ